MRYVCIYILSLVFLLLSFNMTTLRYTYVVRIGETCLLIPEPYFYCEDTQLVIFDCLLPLLKFLNRPLPHTNVGDVRIALLLDLIRDKMTQESKVMRIFARTNLASFSLRSASPLASWQLSQHLNAIFIQDTLAMLPTDASPFPQVYPFSWFPRG